MTPGINYYRSRITPPAGAPAVSPVSRCQSAGIFITARANLRRNYRQPARTRETRVLHRDEGGRGGRGREENPGIFRRLPAAQESFRRKCLRARRREDDGLPRELNGASAGITFNSGAAPTFKSQQVHDIFFYRLSTTERWHPVGDPAGMHRANATRRKYDEPRVSSGNSIIRFSLLRKFDKN